MSSPLLDTYEQLPFTVERGDGVWIYDSTGNRYLDMYGGHAVSLLGHNPPEVLSAIKEQSKKLFFYSNIAPLAVREHGAKKLAEILPKSLRHIFFCNSGAEANENALKLAIRLTKRDKLVSYKGSFHGRTLLATAVTDAPKTHVELGGWCTDKVTFISPNAIDDLGKITKEAAAVILEPIQSIGGVISFEENYLHALRKRCDEVGALLIFDEVQTGFGRTGDPFVSGYCGVLPDMCTTAKGIGSGYPIGALFVSDAVAKLVKSGDLGATYGAGPVAMAVVGATVQTLVEKKLFDHVKKLHSLFQKCAAIKGVVEVRGKGCLIGIKTEKPSLEVIQRLLSEGIVTGSSKDPHVLRLLPPIILTEGQVSQFQETLAKVLQ